MVRPTRPNWIVEEESHIGKNKAAGIYLGSILNSKFHSQFNCHKSLQIAIRVRKNKSTRNFKKISLQFGMIHCKYHASLNFKKILDTC